MRLLIPAGIIIQILFVYMLNYLLLSGIVLLIVFLFLMLGLKSSAVKIDRHDAEPAGWGPLWTEVTNNQRNVRVV